MIRLVLSQGKNIDAIGDHGTAAQGGKRRALRSGIPWYLALTGRFQVRVFSLVCGLNRKTARCV